MIEKLHAVSFPVPRPYLYCRDASIIGTEFYIMEYVEVCHITTASAPERASSTLHMSHPAAHVSPCCTCLTLLHKSHPAAHGSPWPRAASFGTHNCQTARRGSARTSTRP